jgi:hypothetical protein
MSDVSIRGRYRRPAPAPRTPQEPRYETAEDCIYPMPSVEEVVRAGYQATYWDKIKAERDEFIQRFNAEPEFRTAAIERAKKEHAARLAYEEQRKRERSGPPEE